MGTIVFGLTLGLLLVLSGAATQPVSWLADGSYAVAEASSADDASGEAVYLTNARAGSRARMGTHIPLQDMHFRTTTALYKFHRHFVL